ncbi:MAG: 4-hydroxy-tetrahydrodipicolinate reductase [Candidatus Omnitrophota bacterium]
MLKIGISGVCGRMGRSIAELALKQEGVTVSAVFERPDADQIKKDLGLVLGGKEKGIIITSDIENVCKDIDCLIEFTFPFPTMEHLAICAKNNIAMVIGTTALTADDEEKIKQASARIPIVFSPNMSIGVNLLFDVVRQAVRVLGNDFDVKVDETHHVHKKDSPSGTAKMIAKVIKEFSGKEISIEAFREGEVIGNHGVIFESPYESIEIRHDAKSRDVFAVGALKAARFLEGKEPGLYDMNDVLGLK